MAGLTFQYTKQEDIPETVDFRALFTEKNGKWELTGIDGVKTQADIDRIQVGAEKERSDHKETKAKLAVWADLDHADTVAKLDRLPELEAASKGKLDENAIEEIVTRRVEGTLKSKLSPLEREVRSLKKERDELAEANVGFVQANTKRTVSDALRGAMKTAKVRSEAEDDVLNYAPIFEITEEGAVVTRDGCGVAPGLDPAGWIAEIEDRKPHWWPPSQGGGARGSGPAGGGFQGKNPWSAEHWNLTEQGKIVKEKGREKANQLAAAAGSRVGATSPTRKAT